MTPSSALASAPVFSSLRPEELARIAAHAQTRRLEAGAQLCRADEPATTVWCLLDGQVRVTSPGSAPRSVTTGVLGEEAALGLPTYLSDAVVEVACTVLALPGRIVQRVLDDDTERNGGSEAAFRPLLERWRSALSIRDAGGAPLATKQPPVLIMLGWVLAVALPALILHVGTGMDLEWGQVHFLVALAAGVILWTFHLVPPMVAILVPMTLTMLLGIVEPPVMLSGFGSRVFFMVLSIYGVAIPILSSGLVPRGILLLLKILPKTPRSQELGIFLGGVLLTPVIPSPERRVRILAPLASDLQGGDQVGGSSRLLLAAVLGTTIFTPIFLSSAPLNFVIYGLLSEQMQVELPWLRWASAATVVGLVLLLGYPILMGLLFRRLPRPSYAGSVDEKLQLLGPMKVAEWIALLGGLLFVVASATPGIHQIDPRLVALTIFSVYVMVRVISHRDINLEIDWTFLIFLGAILGISATATTIQIDRLLIEQIPGLRGFMRNSPQLFVLGGVATALILGRFIPMSAAFVAFFAMTLAAINGLNVWVVGFTILVAGESWFLRKGTPMHALVARFAEDDPSWSSRRFVQLGIGLALVRILAILASLPFWTYREML
jgi:DASS family divalent anion:Na+ symporter